MSAVLNLATHVKLFNKSTSEFNDVVNMTPTGLRDSLEKERSESLGWMGDSGETVGHQRSDKIYRGVSQNTTS